MTTKKSNNTSQLAFVGQRPDEELILVFRRHLIAMRKGFYMLLVPLVVTSLPLVIWPYSVELYIVPLIGLAIGLLLFAYQYMMWYFTVYIVTNQRLRQVTQKGFFGKDVIELQLSKVQNISYNIPGFGGEIFRYGTIVIQTYVGDLIIKNVDDPEKIYNQLQDAVNNASKGVGNHEENFL
jgi:hypothetical protein